MFKILRRTHANSETTGVRTLYCFARQRLHKRWLSGDSQMPESLPPLDGLILLSCCYCPG
eukprot:743692-Amphidinium_carterae.1